MTNDRDDIEVSYTVKELLGRIELKQTEGFARLEVSMSGKADKADVARMEARLDAHGERLGSLEQSRRDVEMRKATDQFRWRRWQKIGGFGVGSAVLIGGILESLAALHAF